MVTEITNCTDCPFFQWEDATSAHGPRCGSGVEPEPEIDIFEGSSGFGCFDVMDSSNCPLKDKDIVVKRKKK